MIRERNKFGSNRLAVLGTVIFIFTVIVILKLAYLMIVKHDYYIALANNQHYANTELNPNRGDIYLQDYKEPDKLYPYATNRKYYLVYANTIEVKYPQDWVVYYSSGKEPPYYIPLKAQSYFQPKDKTVPLVGIEAMGSTWEQEIAALNIEYEQYQQLTIDGYEAIKKEEVISNDASIRIAVNGPQKKVYEIILHEFAITKTQTDVEIFNQILSTFKFTK